MSVVIPAYCEVGRVGEAVRSVSAALDRAGDASYEILVVDDGSPDATAEEAATAGARVIRQAQNRGKGAALERGFHEARGELLLMLDADLGATAGAGVRLLEPLREGRADMVVGVPASIGKGGGFGWVMRLARWGLVRHGAPAMRAPLSGQRALTRAAWERIGRLEPGFGLEMGLNLDAARLGLRVVEVDLDVRHRVTGRDLAGFRHRGRQFRDILLTLWRRR